MLEELEPLDISDLLFEERAVDVYTHDKITESRHRRNQIKYLLDTVRENRNECFHFFLFILQKRYIYICNMLKESTVAATGESLFIETCPVKYDLARTKGSFVNVV